MKNEELWCCSNIQKQHVRQIIIRIPNNYELFWNSMVFRDFAAYNNCDIVAIIYLILTFVDESVVHDEGAGDGNVEGGIVDRLDLHHVLAF